MPRPRARAPKTEKKPWTELALIAAALLAFVAVSGYQFVHRRRAARNRVEVEREVITRRESPPGRSGLTKVHSEVKANTENWLREKGDQLAEAAPGEEKEAPRLKPAIQVFENQDVYLPLRVLVGEGEPKPESRWFEPEKKTPPPLTE